MCGCGSRAGSELYENQHHFIKRSYYDIRRPSADLPPGASSTKSAYTESMARSSTSSTSAPTTSAVNNGTANNRQVSDKSVLGRHRAVPCRGHLSEDKKKWNKTCKILRKKEKKSSKIVWDMARLSKGLHVDFFVLFCFFFFLFFPLNLSAFPLL